MNPETKFVVNPLETYFLDFVRSGAKWNTKAKPKYETSATGWDLQMERKNQVLLIEAKYIRGPFASAFAGLVIAPLSNRPETMKSKKKKSWCSTICWAIGCNYKEGVYQILLDYLSRNLEFWKCYSKKLKVEYIFFIDKEKVAQIRFNKIINFATRYKLSADKPLHEKRLVAKNLLKNLKFK